MVWGTNREIYETSEVVKLLQRFLKDQGQFVGEGILRLWNWNLGPNCGKQILDARILDPNSWVEFFIL